MILVDEDTKSKSFWCEGEALILSDILSKISNKIILSVNGKPFSIAVSEEKWRMDLD